jgi:hypothetical protein
MLKNKINSITVNFLQKESGITRYYVERIINNIQFQSELIEFVKTFAQKNPELLKSKFNKKTTPKE